MIGTAPQCPTQDRWYAKTLSHQCWPNTRRWECAKGAKSVSVLPVAPDDLAVQWYLSRLNHIGPVLTVSSYLTYIAYDMKYESHNTVLQFNCFCVNQPKSICKQNDLISLSFYFDLKKWTFHKWIIIQNYDHALFYKRDSAWITWFSIIYFKQNQLNWVKLDFTMMKIPQKRCIPSFLKIQFYFSYKVTGLNTVLVKQI